MDRRLRLGELGAREDLVSPLSTTFQAYGHPNLRVTHAKTFEVTAGADVTERATCVIGVDASIPREISLLRGEVRIRLAAGSAIAEGTATINPDHAVRDRLIIRRSDHRDPDTLAINSTLTASDLPKEFGEAVRSGEPIRMTVSEIRAPRPLVVLGTPEAGTRLATLLEGWVPTGLRVHGTVAGSAYHLGEWTSTAARAWLAASGDARVVAAVPAAEPVVPLLAARRPAAPATWLGRLDRAALKRSALRQALNESPLPVVATVAPDDAAEVLHGMAEVAPDRLIAVRDRVVDIGTAMEWLPVLAAIERLAGGESEEPFVVAPDDAGGTVSVSALLRALTAAGVPARTVAEALAPLGWDRRKLYDLRNGE